MLLGLDGGLGDVIGEGFFQFFGRKLLHGKFQRIVGLFDVIGLVDGGSKLSDDDALGHGGFLQRKILGQAEVKALPDALITQRQRQGVGQVNVGVEAQREPDGQLGALERPLDGAVEIQVRDILCSSLFAVEGTDVVDGLAADDDDLGFLGVQMQRPPPMSLLAPQPAQCSLQLGVTSAREAFSYSRRRKALETPTSM